ncbi:GNAT family N-acetyltransferase [Cylindrospermum sp. FACHB-282]|uniref:GNAT family N-acetyltransferase n=1 Tax=Cylindrospermum sp. FACHB-282 TaxID=2692794 RepID=UPI0016836E5A|nr:GNAT family N-acetyltransferase [Cylindrospermum sp. FACHB-282]MBD2384336.1 GNAT family N-acetyltransferase [Cylindrospermum sp. FACHB-282]
MKIFLETERLIFRQFTENDLDNLFELNNDPDVVRFANLTGKPTEYEDIKQQVLPRFLKYYNLYDSYGIWAAIEKSSKNFIGWFHFRPNLENTAIDNPEEIELGYRLRKSAWGKGYATEGSRELILKGFSELKIQCVVATALVANVASIRVMEKAGLKFERYFLETRFIGGNQEAVKYSLDQAQFRIEEYLAT